MNSPRDPSLIHPLSLPLLLAITILTSTLSSAPLASKITQSGNFEITATRLPENPIITCDFSDMLGTKINGPSIISVPD